MARETKTKAINGLDVGVRPFDCFHQGDLLVELGAKAAPLLRMIEQVSFASGEGMGAAAAELFLKLERGDFGRIAIALLADTLVQGTDGQGKPFAVSCESKERIAQAFGTDLDALVQAMAWSVEVNYAGFFAAWKARVVAKIKAMAAEAAALAKAPVVADAST